MSKRKKVENIPEKVFQMAVGWTVRRDSRPLTPEEQKAFQRWLGADPLHRKAWEQTQNLWSDMDHLEVKTVSAEKETSKSQQERAPEVRPLISAIQIRAFWKRPALIAACLALFLIFPGNNFLVQWTADSATSIGEIRLVNLPDGSKVHLNTDSAIDLDFSDKRRTVYLLKGEAEFHVAHDEKRPFEVKAAGGSATALGTAFVVRREENKVTVTVLENRVEVAYLNQNGDNLDSNILKPSQQTSFSPKTGLQGIREVLPENVNAWSRGKLIFENQPLEEVISELSRYHNGRIEILGESLGDLKVNGVFPVNDPIKVVQALESSFDLKSRSLGDLMIFLYQ